MPHIAKLLKYMNENKKTTQVAHTLNFVQLAGLKLEAPIALRHTLSRALLKYKVCHSLRFSLLYYTRQQMSTPFVKFG